MRGGLKVWALEGPVKAEWLDRGSPLLDWKCK